LLITLPTIDAYRSRRRPAARHRNAVSAIGVVSSFYVACSRVLALAALLGGQQRVFCEQAIEPLAGEVRGGDLGQVYADRTG